MCIARADEPSAIVRLASSQPLCFPIRHIYLYGLTEQLAFLQTDVRRYQGECLGVADIQKISSVMTNDLVAHGYVTTRIRVPQQNLVGGALALQVMPGLLHAVHLSKHARTSWKDAFPIRPGDVLNERDLEQGLEQMERVPSQDVHMAIQPAQEVGASDLMIDVKQQKPWRLAFDVNDAGSSGTGRVQGSVTAELDNPFGANDMFHVGLNNNVQGGIGGGARGDNFYYSIPLGYWTLEANASRFSYSQTIAGYENAYTMSGIQHSSGLSAERMMYRSQTVKTSLTLSIVNSTSSSFLDNAEINVQYRNETYAEIQLERAWSIGNQSLDVSLGLRNGLPIFGAQRDEQVLDAPENYYNMQLINASASFPVRGTHILWQPTLSAQINDGSVLYPNDQFAIGNQFTVRGFDGSDSLTAESGYYLRNDLVFPGSPLHQFYVGFDTGSVWGYSAQFLAGHSLMGIAAGFRGQYKTMHYNVFTGVAVHAPVIFYQSAQPAGGFDLQWGV